MDKDLIPWIHMQHLRWQHTNLNSASRFSSPNMWQQSTNPMVFPASTNLYGYTPSETKPHGLVGSEFLPQSAFNMPLNSMNLPSGATGHKRFLIFDQSGDGTSLIFSSARPPFWNPSTSRACKPKTSSHDFGVDLPVFNDPINQPAETNVSDGHGGDEMHEDSDEIDALLYSDSEKEDDEEASTGHSPAAEMVEREEEVASSTLPSKGRRLNEEIDPSLIDTASSTGVHPGANMGYKITIDSDASSYVSGRAERGGGGKHYLKANSNKRFKRKKIPETMAILKTIIPGGKGKGKDAAMVLDEAIRYLKTLKLKLKP